jgi:putative phosphoserine phosphatase/1-acylglycerol-3-phosphate O-acyltransferase
VNVHGHVTAEVDRAAKGASTAAFFDFDGTLIAAYSVSSFLKRRLMSGNMPPRELFAQLTAAWQYAIAKDQFAHALLDSAQALRGVSDESLARTAREVYEQDLAGEIFPECRALVDAHKRRGHTVVIVTSATQYQVRHVAEELGVEHILCTELEVESGLLTGGVVPPVCYGKGKRDAALEFARRQGVDLEKSFFYTDGFEDVPLLESVGRPRPVNPDSRLERTARREGWPIKKFSSRGLPRLADVVRTSLVYGGLAGSLFAGVPAWLLNRSRRDLANVAISVWGDFGSAVAGLDIETDGEEHLWSHRPAVFIFNHQSQTDALIISHLLRRDFTGVAKKEMKSNLLVGTVLDAVGTVFIDRSKSDEAIEALKPAVRSLKNGVSFAIAPEGSRSTGYRLGTFKMGAFHIAMQAGVPIVPIVIQNSSDSQPKGGFFIRPARIRVTVLPPVSTDGWTNETVHEHANSVRKSFLDVLSQASEKDVKLRRVK